MSEIFGRVIRKRRAEQEKGNVADKPDDYLQVCSGLGTCHHPTPPEQMLIDARYRDGSTPTDEEITGLLVAALFAGQHTSSITSTWMGLMCLSQKDTLMYRPSSTCLCLTFFQSSSVGRANKSARRFKRGDHV